MLTLDEAYLQVEKFYTAHKKGLNETIFEIYETQEEAFSEASRQWHNKNKVTGAYYPADNKIIIIANNNRDIKELYKTIRHEVFGHLALNRLSEIDKFDLLEKIADAPKDSEIGIHREQLLFNEYSNLEGNPIRLAEEVFAHTAERSYEPIGQFISIPDPKQVSSEKDLLDFISALKNGIHHGVLEQKIYPKDNSAQFKIKEKEINMKNELLEKIEKITDKLLNNSDYLEEEVHIKKFNGFIKEENYDKAFAQLPKIRTETRQILELDKLKPLVEKLQVQKAEIYRDQDEFVEEYIADKLNEQLTADNTISVEIKEKMVEYGETMGDSLLLDSIESHDDETKEGLRAYFEYLATHDDYRNMEGFRGQDEAIYRTR